ncbi:uncharacterized protein LOC131876644 [Cryptomeria japonica]|uniref:uncharacterized protein LOC131876644 n=1 Tax=Cryptomeria japonica TaxID=3369 RepID=UPI0027DA1A5B|nr:uncharacterized protein LOC131876644 [Cryptomeria japonica]
MGAIEKGEEEEQENTNSEDGDLGNHVIRFPLEPGDSMIDHNIYMMALIMVGKFMGFKPNIEVVRAFVRKKWKLKGQVEVSAMSKEFFSFSFSCEKYIATILCGGPWVIDKPFMALKKWTPNLDLSSTHFEVVLVWLWLPGLPLKYYNGDIFRGILSSFGELLFIDAMMAARKMMAFPRICVGIVQATNLPSSIDIVSKLGK